MTPALKRGPSDPPRNSSFNPASKRSISTQGVRKPVTLVSRLPILAGEKAAVIDAIVGLLHEAYEGDRWIDPLLPDLLGEHLAQVALEDNPTDILDVVFGPAQ